MADNKFKLVTDDEQVRWRPCHAKPCIHGTIVREGRAPRTRCPCTRTPRLALLLQQLTVADAVPHLPLLLPRARHGQARAANEKARKAALAMDMLLNKGKGKAQAEKLAKEQKVGLLLWRGRREVTLVSMAWPRAAAVPGALPADTCDTRAMARARARTHARARSRRQGWAA